MPAGSGSFRSDQGLSQDKDYNGDGIVLMGVSLDGKRLMLKVNGQGVETTAVMNKFIYDGRDLLLLG